MDTQRIPNNVDIQGDLTVRGSMPAYARSGLVQEDFALYDVGIDRCRIWDAFQTALTTAASDDLGITAGAFATGNPYITAGDLKALGATTRRCRFLFALPPEYVAGQSVRLRFSAGMLTTAADTSCTIDAEAFKLGLTTLVSGADLVSTAATSMNSTTFASINFDLTATTLSPGDYLDVRVSITCTDGATATAVTPAIAAIAMLLDIKG